MEQNEIKKIIAEQLAKGVSLSDIHKMLFDEYKVRMTFMEFRLMASEIENINWAESDAKAESAKSTEPVDDDNEDNGEEDEIFDEDEEAPDDEDVEDAGQSDTSASGEDEKIRSSTTVEINKIARPGAVLSGSVNFGSGASADWVLDQLGRIALANAKGKPDEQDIKEFQIELQKAVSQAY